MNFDRKGQRIAIGFACSLVVYVLRALGRMVVIFNKCEMWLEKSFVFQQNH